MKGNALFCLVKEKHSMYSAAEELNTVFFGLQRSRGRAERWDGTTVMTFVRGAMGKAEQLCESYVGFRVGLYPFT